jgi:hypothetical protein
MVPPEMGLLEDWGPSPRSSEELVSSAIDLLVSLREAYGAAPWVAEPMLDTAARAVLGGSDITTSRLAKTLGYDEERFSRWTCTAGTLEDCIDRIIWDPRARPGLLGETEFIGLAGHIDAKGVHLVILVAAD